MVNSEVTKKSGDLVFAEFPPLGSSGDKIGVDASEEGVVLDGVVVALTGAAQSSANLGVTDAAAKTDVPTAAIGKSDWKSPFNQSLSYFPPVQHDGRVIVRPPQEKTTDRLWGREGSIEIRFLAPSVYIVNFPSRRVRDWVLESGPWHIQQKAILLRRWMPGLMFDILKMDSAPIWVKLWHVPLELFSQCGLGYVASAIGEGRTVSVAVELSVNVTLGDVKESDIGLGHGGQVGETSKIALLETDGSGGQDCEISNNGSARVEDSVVECVTVVGSEFGVDSSSSAMAVVESPN
ncbi:hypothetical protein V6N13_001061 [Hibiscus sabdariffa]